MKTRFLWPGLACVACFVGNAIAADAFIYDYCLKINPGKYQAIRELHRDVEPKLMQALVDRGAITSWALLYASIPGRGPEARCDLHVLYEFPGFPEERNAPRVTDEDLQKVKLTRAEWQERRNSTGTIVNQDVWRVVGRAGAPIEKGSFVFFNPDKANPIADWAKLETTTWQPFADARAKEAAGFGWRALVLFLPRGSGIAYNAATMDIHPNWASIAKGATMDRASTQPDLLWSKVHPDQTRSDYLATVNRVVDRYRIELFEAVEAVHKK